MCTGLEPLLLGMGASAGVASVGASALGAVGSGLLTKALAPKAPKAAVAPIPVPEKPPQAAQAPERAPQLQAAAAMAGGPMAGNASTFLTGSSGVAPGSLSLGRNTLLGQ